MVFGKLLSALKKTRDVLTAGLSRLFSGRKLDEAFLEDLEEVLYNSDLGPVGTRIVEDLKVSYKKREVKDIAEVPPFLRRKLVAMLEGCEAPLVRAPQAPTVILVVGVNGAGKTTSIAKLARHLQLQGKSVLLGAGDTFRAAAVEQLTMWALRMNIPIIKQGTGADPAAVAFDAVSRRDRAQGRLPAPRHRRPPAHAEEPDDRAREDRARRQEAPARWRRTRRCWCSTATTGQNAIRQASEFAKFRPGQRA
jgi:fused signal recognition particle receptor